MSDDKEQLVYRPMSASPETHAIRRQFLESVSAVLLVLAVVGLPFSLVRIYQTGLNPSHISHCCISTTILLVFFLKKRLSERWIVSLVLLIFTALSYTAFLQYGIVSAGFYFAGACIFVAGVTRGLRGGIICAAFHFLAISVMAHLWITGYLTFPGDVREYILLPSVWALLSVAFIITTAVFFVSATISLARLRELMGTIHNQKQEIEDRVAELTQTNRELEAALNEVRTLSGLLPICSHCKKIRDDKGYWNQIESYLRRHSEAEFSHSICPECAKEHYPGLKLDR